MFAACAVFLLCLKSVSHSAPLACEDLVRPLDRMDPRHLEGRWALVTGSLSFLPFMERLRQRESATINFSSNTSETSTSWSRTMRLDSKCHYASYNISLEGSSFTFDHGNVTTIFIRTSCDDCIGLLMSYDVESGKRQHFYLFSRRREVDQEEIEEFRAQVECLNMHPPVVMDPTKELCPEETAGEKTQRQKE